MLLPTCWFDKEKCKAGIEALRMYRREYDEKRQEFRSTRCTTGPATTPTRCDISRSGTRTGPR
jgi:hypothetical protein